MANFLVCEGTLSQAVFNGEPIEGVFSCSTGWIVKPDPSVDFQGLISLLSFDLETCLQLILGCTLLFIFGYGSGFTARMLTRR